MEKEIIHFINEQTLSPFNTRKTLLKAQKSIFKTNDARAVATKVLQHLSRTFIYADTSNIFALFDLGASAEDIRKRQEFFKNTVQLSNRTLKDIHIGKANWKIPYSLIAATEDETTFLTLKERGVSVRLIISESDVAALENFDLIYAVDCDDYSRALEQLDGTVFVNSLEDVYLERHIVTLSQWKDALTKLASAADLPIRMYELIRNLSQLLPLLQEESSQSIDAKTVERAAENINKAIEDKLQSLTISGSQMMAMMQKGALPAEVNAIVHSAIADTALPSQFFVRGVPVRVDEEEVEKAIRKQSMSSSAKFAKRVIRDKETLKQIPMLVKELSAYFLYLDFVGGLQQHLSTSKNIPQLGSELRMQEAVNRLLENAQPISFNLTQEVPCSILTGANSGGKTTLLEHIIQLIIETNLGLPAQNPATIPHFSDIYYFAKNKGSTSKGAFETLLTELSTIKPGKQTLILADEVEAVTEPGVAGQIMKATIEYFIPQGCFMVLATHLGKELQHNLPRGVRVDGIEATGLDSEFNLIVNHNPVLGRLARSTPELIVEKMAKSTENPYLTHLFKELKKSD